VRNERKDPSRSEGRKWETGNENRSFADLYYRVNESPVPEKGFFMEEWLSFLAQDDKMRNPC